MPAAVRWRLQFDERFTARVHELQWPIGQHVGRQSLGKPDPLPDPHHLLVGRDRPCAAVDVGIAFDDNHFQAQLAQKIGRCGAGGPVADDRDVIGRCGHGDLVSQRYRLRLVPVVITTVSCMIEQESRPNHRGESPVPEERKTRRRRANGEESRSRILDATAEIASRTRLRGHLHRARQRQVRPACQLHLLAFQGQGRPDRRGDRAQLRPVDARVAVARRRQRPRPVRDAGQADRQGDAGLPGLHATRVDAGAGTPTRRTPRPLDVPRRARAGVSPDRGDHS